MTNLSTPTVGAPVVGEQMQGPHGLEKDLQWPITRKAMDDDPIDELLADIFEMLLSTGSDCVDNETAT